MQTRVIVAPPASGKSTWIRERENVRYVDLDRAPGFNRVWKLKKATGDRRHVYDYMVQLLKDLPNSILFTAEAEVVHPQTCVVLIDIETYIVRCNLRKADIEETGKGWRIDYPQYTWWKYHKMGCEQRLPIFDTFNQAATYDWSL